MSNPNNVYSSFTDFSGMGSARELNLRQELKNTFFGTAIEIAKSQHGLLRKIRFDNKNKPIKCPCVDRVTGEQDRDYFCPICMSERYMWDETIINFYQVTHADDKSLVNRPMGNVGLHNSVFYVVDDVIIGDYDKIILINLDGEGNIVYPITRTEIWQPTEIVQFRLDRGRIEYSKIHARHEDTKYLKAPAF